jgi:hypothetical protein
VGRKLAIEKHPDREKIDQELLNKVPMMKIAAKYGISRKAVSHYRKSFAGQFRAVATERTSLVTKSVEELEGFREELRGAESIWSTLRQITQRAWMVLDACHVYLQDPDDPGKYDLGPRGRDITVVMDETDNEGRVIKKKAKLSDLIDEIRGAGRNVTEVNYRIADPRRLILETANTLNKQLELIARIQGELKDQTINITQTVEWREIQNTLLQVTKDVPEVREKIANALSAGSSAGSARVGAGGTPANSNR